MLRLEFKAANSAAHGKQGYRFIKIDVALALCCGRGGIKGTYFKPTLAGLAICLFISVGKQR